MDPPSTTTYTLPPADQQDPLEPEFEQPSSRGCVDQQLCERPSIWRQLWGIRNVLIVLLTPIILLPLPLAADDPKTQCAYVILVMAVFWITEAVPIAATSLIPIFLFPMMGLLSARTVSATYLNDTSVLFLGGLIVAVAIETWDLHKRIAIGVLMLVGAEPKWLMAGLMAVTWFLSMWISNTATTAMMIPIVQAVLQQLKTSGHGDQEQSPTDEGQCMANGRVQLEMTPIGDDVKKPVEDQTKVDVSNDNKVQPLGATPEEHTRSAQAKATQIEEAKHLRMCKAMSLSICYAANVGGIASLTGTGPNLVLKGQSDIIFTDNNATSPITFSTWLVYGVPLSLIVLVLLWIWMQIYFLRCRGFCDCFNGGTNGDASKRVKAVIREEFRKLGPVSFAQWCIMIFFGILVVLWITRDFGEVAGWGEIFRPNFVSDSTPAIFVSFLLFVCPANVPNVFCLRKPGDLTKPKIRPILRWQDVHEKMPWSLYLILGAGYSLARASQDSGLSEWLGGKLGVFSHLDPYLMLLILCYIVAFATEVTSNTAIATLMMPIMAQLAVNLNVNPLFFMFPTALATSFAFMLPVATPPNAIVFSYGQVRVIDMVTCGFLMNIISVPVIILATATWGNAFFNFDTLPPGFIQATTPLSLFNASSPLPLLLNATG
ncbi:solute carrier family 13 member 2-like [Haliotis cracherodii]|uniref:solute carrier family 13 member 2-like n=1 Tax=Haliotis cracherodii TaxID=6455 RepID=UPI0039E81BD3